MDIYNTLTNEEYIRDSFQEIISSDLYFINHHYLSRYISIISKFKERNFLKKEHPGFHGHHIVPKCLSGTNEKKNLVTLSPREHYIIHHLLWKAFPKTNLTTAFKSMVHGFKHYHGNRITSRVYEQLCLDYYPINRERTRERNLGRKHSEESKLKMSESAKNKPPISEETKQKMSESAKNRPPVSNETKKKLSESGTGRKFSEETRKKLSESSTGRKHSEETRKKLSENQKGRKHSEESRKRLANQIWVCSPFDKKQIQKESLDEYLSKGYIRGMKYNNNICNFL